MRNNEKKRVMRESSWMWAMKQERATGGKQGEKNNLAQWRCNKIEAAIEVCYVCPQQPSFANLSLRVDPFHLFVTLVSSDLKSHTLMSHDNILFSDHSKPLPTTLVYLHVLLSGSFVEHFVTLLCERCCAENTVLTLQEAKCA